MPQQLTRQWCFRMMKLKRMPQHAQFSASSSLIHTPVSLVFLLLCSEKKSMLFECAVAT